METREYNVVINGKEYRLYHPWGSRHAYNIEVVNDPENFKKEEIEKYSWMNSTDALAYLVEQFDADTGKYIRELSRRRFCRPLDKYDRRGMDEWTIPQAKAKMREKLRGGKPEGSLFTMNNISVADLNRFNYGGGEEDYYDYYDDTLDSQLGWDWSDYEDIKLSARNFSWSRDCVWCMEFPRPHIIGYKIELNIVSEEEEP